MMGIKLSRNEKLAVLGVGALFLVPKLGGFMAQKAGQMIIDLPVSLAKGAVISVGEKVGIPQVSASKCKADILAGDSWNASFDCDAATYLKYVWNKNSAGFDPNAFTAGMAGLGAVPDWKTLALLGAALYLMAKKKGRK